MKPNIGLLNALIRITCGLTTLAWATSKLVRRPSESGPFFIAIMGAMKVAEGITRFCPITYLYQERVHDNVEEVETEGEKLPINPT
ncbi:DUF2892 domain-containing protein [Evansella sp. AB-P1]|uniref:YgaP family membrane protein n=1 Tax=Evansella sp. AB-P1 TaxID=3037653 RepID=UPI00241EEDB6|nr:DUF2892 domain-containing protein [Evansella sp. AB-P1]MDG5785941.1 DUF2892 domain-containing protein [Evansella sp. AB-P1]